jgi:hypothetical protein
VESISKVGYWLSQLHFNGVPDHVDTGYNDPDPDVWLANQVTMGGPLVSAAALPAAASSIIKMAVTATIR